MKIGIEMQLLMLAENVHGSGLIKYYAWVNIQGVFGIAPKTSTLKMKKLNGCYKHKLIQLLD